MKERTSRKATKMDLQRLIRKIYLCQKLLFLLSTN